MSDAATGDNPTGIAEPPPSAPLGSWYLGIVSRVSAAGEEGFIRSEGSGRDYPYSIALAQIMGGGGPPRRLRAGTRVGFDLAWTAHGVRVSVIRLLD